MKNFLRLGLFSIFLVTSICFAQTLTMAELLQGDKIKLQLPLADLPSHYKSVELGQTGQGAGGGLFETLMGSFMGAFGPGQEKGDSPEAAFFSLMSLSFTDGEEITLNDAKFLVTYKLSVDSKMMSSKEPDFSKVFWKLCLLKTSEIRSITASQSWSAGDVVKLMTDLQKKVSGAKDAAQATASLSRAKQFGLSLVICINDREDIFPYVQSTSSLRGVLMPYAKDPDVFTSGNPDGGSMLFNMSLAGTSSSEIESPQNTVMLYDSQPWPDGRRIVVFADSSARFVDAAEWTALKNTLNLKLKKYGQPLPKDHMVEADPLRGKSPA